MKKGRDGLSDGGNTEAGDTLSNEGADVGTLMDRDIKAEVAPDGGIYEPSVAEVLRVRHKKGYDEAEKPERVYLRRRWVVVIAMH